MRSKARHEGYLLIDHSASPGITPEFAALTNSPVVPGGAVGEFATMRCNHCQAIVIRNPDRTRARAYCRKCDHYICDGCEAVRVQTLTCVPVDKQVDLILDDAAKGRPVRRLILPRQP